MRCRAALNAARCARVLQYRPARLVPRLAAPPIPGGDLFAGRHTFHRITPTSSTAGLEKCRRDAAIQFIRTVLHKFTKFSPEQLRLLWEPSRKTGVYGVYGSTNVLE